MHGLHCGCVSVFVALLLVARPDPAQAEVYRCQKNGRLVFTDVPCAAGAQPLAPRQPISAQADGPADLAASADQRRSRDLKQHQQADAAWLKAHADRSAEELRLRNALVEGRVVQGMSATQVRQVWGEPSDVETSLAGAAQRERWVYRQGKRRKTVSFEDGKVRGMSGNQAD